MIYRYRWFFIVAPLVIAIGLLVPLREARINPDLNAYLPDDMPAKQSIRRLDSIFGKYEPILVFFETEDALAAPTLERIREKLRQIEAGQPVDTAPVGEEKPVDVP